MLSSSSEASRHQPLDNGDGSNNIVISNSLVNSGSNKIFNFGGHIGHRYGNIIASGSNNIIILDDSEDIELDELLNDHISKDALRNSFHSPPTCHPDTRTTIREEIGAWIDESISKKSPLLWLNGPAGVGKSVIAKTVSDFHDQVVATFFFSTSSDRSAATLFPTLAWQLARRIPETRKLIIASLKNSGLLQVTRIEEQFELLILQPLKKITTLGPRPVMVIDGVDDCTDERMLERFLRVLVQAGEGGDMPLRFIICSRPEPQIRTLLERDYHSRFEPHLHTQWSRDSTHFLQDIWELYRPWRYVDKYVPTLTKTLDTIYPHPVISTIRIGFSQECRDDIATYLTDKFNTICQLGASTSPWFRPSDISDFVQASCGQFLYASTIVRLLDDINFDTRDVFEMARDSSLPTPDLDKLYKAILKRAQDTLRDQARSGDPNLQKELRLLMDVLAILVFFAENVHFLTLSENFPFIESFLGLERNKLLKKLCGLRSVLLIVPGKSIRVYHRSFLEFLQSRLRSGEYHISSSTALRRILILVARAGFRYNIFMNNDSGKLYIQDMVVAFHRNFFERSRFPAVLYCLHFLIHLLMFVSYYAFLLPLALPGALLAFLSVIGSFTFSLTIYTFFLDYSIIVPFFHPFLHPLFVVTGGFLLHLRLFSIVAFIWLIGLVLRLYYF